MHVTIETVDDRFEVKSPFALKDEIKSILGRYWDKDRKRWCFPATPAMAWHLYHALESQTLHCDQGFGDLLEQIGDGRGCQFSPTKTTCFKHQEQGLDRILSGQGTYLAWEMGTGKTKTVIDAATCGGMKRVLVVCPKSVVKNWPLQWKIHGDTTEFSVLPLIGIPVGKRASRLKTQLSRDKPLCAVTNYEAAWRGPLADVLTSTEWDMIVCDEIHRIKDPRGKASNFIFELRKCGKKFVGLSGTPIPSTPLDLFGQMRFIDPGVYGTHFVMFRLRFAVLGGYEKKQVVSFKNTDDMNRRFNLVAHQVKKEEVLDLPPVTHTEAVVELSQKARLVYEGVKSRIKTEIEEGKITAANALVRLLRLQQITGGAVQYDEMKAPTEIDRAKLEALIEILSDLPEDEAVVVFAKFSYDIEMIHLAAQKAGRTSAEISGNVDTLRDWQEGAPGGPTVLAAQIRAGGIGVDMTRARYCVIYSLGFSLGDYEQAIARLDRQGQTRKVEYIHLIAENTVDETVYEALRRKARVVESVVNNLKGGGDGPAERAS